MPQPLQNLKNNIPVVLVIAGSDSSGGAGIQADLKTLTALHCYAITTITAVTAQTSSHVKKVTVVDGSTIESQLAAACEGFNFTAMKIGLLPDVKTTKLVASFLEKIQVPVVFDPVAFSSGSEALVEDSAYELFADLLLPKVDIITPNLSEASLLTGYDVTNHNEMQKAAEQIYQWLKPSEHRAVYLKGGHLDSGVSDDLFFYKKEQHWLRYKKLVDVDVHGSGCCLSSAIAAEIAHGNYQKDTLSAMTNAKRFVTAAIENAIQLGNEKAIINPLYKRA